MRGIALLKPLGLLAIVAAAMVIGVGAQAEPVPRTLKAKGLLMPTDLQFSPDGRLLASYHLPFTPSDRGQQNSGGQPALAVWDVTRGKLLWHEMTPGLLLGGLFSRHHHLFEFSPDSSLLAVPSWKLAAPLDFGGPQGGISLYAAATGRLQRTCQFETIGPPHSPLAFSPDGKRLAFWLMPDSIQLWNPKTAVRSAVIRQPYPSGVEDMAFSPDSRILVTCGMGMNVQTLQPQGPAMAGGFNSTTNGTFVLDFWDTSSGTSSHSAKTKEYVMDMAFSPDGKRLAAAMEASVAVFDVATGKLRRTFRSGGERLAFANDGQAVVIVSFATGKIRVCVADLTSGTSKKTLETRPFGQIAALAPVVLSADGQLLAIGASMTSPLVRIYETRSGRQLAAYRAAKRKAMDNLTGVISPDNREFATARGDGTIELWPIPAVSPSTSGRAGEASKSSATDRKQ
jgi:WD40 repeat protein